MKKLFVMMLCLGLLVGCSTSSDKTENGDIIKVDYIGKLDGVAFNGGTATDALLELGSGTYIPGFEEQLIGLKLNEKKTIKVTFPANYQATELAGKETTFDVTIKDIYKKSK